MNNHVHLAIQVGDIPLSRVMQNISLRYTQWFNWRLQRCGHVFQGRYKAVMVDADSYLLELAAYIHLNPVRAGLVDQAEKHRWSSHRAYLGKEQIEWLDPVLVLSQFSDKTGKARSMFAAFVAERKAEGRKAEFHGEKTQDNRLFGADRFIEEILAQTDLPPAHKPDAATVLDAVTRLYRMSVAQMAAPGQERMASEARSVAAWATRELSCGTLAELVPMLKRNASTLTCAITRLENKLERDAGLVGKLEELMRILQ
jgi:hypothetical protein